jgi:acyl carrier protein/SAM-dependent methyltransferase
VSIEETISRHIADEIMLENDQTQIAYDEDLIKLGVLDSLALLKLIVFVEEQFDVKVDGEELIPDNFRTINQIKAFIKSKEQAHQPSSRPLLHTVDTRVAKGTNQKPEAQKDNTESRIKILTLANRFFESDILFSLLRLDIFNLIGEETKTAVDLASEVKSKPDTLARLLNAGVVLGLLESQDGSQYRLSSASRTVLLREKSEQYLGDAIRHMDYIHSAVSHLDGAVRTSAPTVDVAACLGEDKKSTQMFILSMHDYAWFYAEELARTLDMTGCKSFLDLGCGPGTYSFHLGMRYPEVKLNLLDLEGTLDIAKDIQTRFSLKNDVQYLPLDFMKEEIPGSYDMIFVSGILRGLGEAASRRLIAKLYNVINPGGSLVVQCQYAQDNYLGSREAIYLDLTMLCTTPNGKVFSISDTSRWLEDAGFTGIECRSMSMLNPNRFIRGYKI